MGFGRDFWLYRVGQFISTLGDSCTTVATGWWILEQTHSPELMSTIMLVGISTRLVIHPILSPLGDRLSRKGLMLSGYGLSAAAAGSFAAMAYSEHFDVMLVIVLSPLELLEWYCSAWGQPERW